MMIYLLLRLVKEAVECKYTNVHKVLGKRNKPFLHVFETFIIISHYFIKHIELDIITAHHVSHINGL